MRNQAKVSSCNDSAEFFCPNSKQCIPKDWLCDGAIQCLKGEDEDFEICNVTFPNDIATITCEESDRPDGISIHIKGNSISKST